MNETCFDAIVVDEGQDFLGDTVALVEKALRPIRHGAEGACATNYPPGAGLEEAQFRAQSKSLSEQVTEKKEVVAAGPVSRILSAAFDAAGRPFLWAAHYCTAQATYPKV